jgi:hypothetical protein
MLAATLFMRFNEFVEHLLSHPEGKFGLTEEELSLQSQHLLVQAIQTAVQRTGFIGNWFQKIKAFGNAIEVGFMEDNFLYVPIDLLERHADQPMRIDPRSFASSLQDSALAVRNVAASQVSANQMIRDLRIQNRDLLLQNRELIRRSDRQDRMLDQILQLLGSRNGSCFTSPATHPRDDVSPRLDRVATGELVPPALSLDDDDMPKNWNFTARLGFEPSTPII